MARRRPVQQELFETARSARAEKKRGRKARPERLGFMPHRSRAGHDASHPMHVTMKRVAARASLRSQRVFGAIQAQIAYAVRRGVGVLHYTVQHDHVHLVIEADDRVRASRGMQFLFSRIAQEVNRVERRHGKLFRDRHHRRPLITPREVRNCLVYVMFNDRKHATSVAELTRDAGWIDPCSSAMWFEDWDPRDAPPPQSRAGPSPLARPRTWLAQIGWMKAPGGAIRFNERPRGSAWINARELREDR